MGSLLSHPCGKNKGVARMGHPRLVTIPELFPGLKSEILRLRSEQALHAANDGAVRGTPAPGHRLLFLDDPYEGAVRKFAFEQMNHAILYVALEFLSRGT